MLQLAGSGNKVLSAMGREAFPKFIELVRFESIVKDDKGLLYWLGGMKQPPVKLCCLNALLQALQTPGFVVPSVPTLHVMVTGSAFATKWREGKVFREFKAMS